MISYLPSREESYRRAGSYVGNLRTARTLRISLPQALVVRADRLID